MSLISCLEDHFLCKLIPRLDDEGGSEDVYKHPVTVKAEYDPKVCFLFTKFKDTSCA